MTELEAIRSWVAVDPDSHPPTHSELAFLLGLLDEAVELLTPWASWSDPPYGFQDDVDAARAFLARLGRDQ